MQLYDKVETAALAAEDDIIMRQVAVQAAEQTLEQTLARVKDRICACRQAIEDAIENMDSAIGQLPRPIAVPVSRRTNKLEPSKYNCPRCSLPLIVEDNAICVDKGRMFRDRAAVIEKAAKDLLGVADSKARREQLRAALDLPDGETI